MSLLLDALNKADQERKRNEASPGINSNHGQINELSTRTTSIVVVAAIFIGFVILLATIYWLGQRSSSVVPVAEKVPNLLASTDEANSQLAFESSTFSNRKSALSTNNPTVKADTEATLITDQNAEVTPVTPDVTDLYAQNAEVDDAVTLASIPTSESTQTSESMQTIESTPLHSNESIEAISSSTPTSIAQFANLPDLHDLPRQVLIKIPSLNYSEHNYNNLGGSVKINGEIKHLNDQLGAGVVIDKILEDGMILHVANYSFKMRALNSWVNM